MKDVLTTLLSITLGSGIIWAAVLLLRKVFQKHLSPTMRMVLWSLFLLRLILPVSIETGFVLPEFAWPSPTPAAVHSGASAPEPVVQGPIAVRDDSSELLPKQVLPAKSDASRTQTPLAPSPEPLEPFPQEALWLTVWLSGAAVSAMAAILAYRQLIARLHAHSIPGGEDLNSLLHTCQREVGMRAHVRLTLQRTAGGPALVFPNILVLPEKVLTLSNTDIQMALRHELTHYRRGDQILSMLLCLLRVVYWFNPFVWLAIRAIRDDLETACDHDVLRRLGPSGRPDYARSVLAMYKNANTPQSVLGMAAGSGRKHVEARIKGMYLPMKSNGRARIVSLVLIGMLGLACFTTGCQPTPEREAVVNQANSNPVESGARVEANPHYLPVAYTAEQRWQESQEKENVTIVADVDVMIPDVEARCSEKVTELELTQEAVDHIIERLVGSDQEFVQLPVPRDKASYERELLKAKEARAQAESRGEDLEAQLQGFDKQIAEIEEKIRQAPENVELKAATTQFTHDRDQQGNELPDTPEDYIRIGAQKNDSAAIINVDRTRVTARTPPSFHYCACQNVWSESQASEDLKMYPEGEDEATRAQDAMNVMAAYDLDAAAQEQRGAQLLEELGLSGVQIVACEKAAFSPLEDVRNAGDSGRDDPLLPGAYLTFARETGGIPCSPDQQSGWGPEDISAEAYRPPFFPESGSLLLDADGNVMLFSWRDMSQAEADSLVAVKTLSFDEIKDRAMDNMYYYAEQVYGELYDVDVAVTKAELVGAYINVADEPDSAMVVPAWEVQAECVGTDSVGEKIEMSSPPFFINAVDGSLIATPTLESADYQ